MNINGLEANSIYKEMQLLLSTFNIDLSRCILCCEDVNKIK